MEGDPAAPAAAAPAQPSAQPQQQQQQQQPVKRKRGRPRKSETPGAGTPGSDSAPPKPKKQRKRKGDTGPAPSSVDVSMIGQQVTGVLEGTFDAGYLLSVRVGTSDTILRGVVFGPGLSVPLSKLNDVAPGVKQVRREEAKPLALPPPAPKPRPTPNTAPRHYSAPLSFIVPSHHPSSIPPTSAVLESAAALFGNTISAAPSPPQSTGLVAALQQLPGGGYTSDAATFAQPPFHPESVKSL